MNIQLSPEHDQFVRAKVDSGRYADPNAVVRDALNLLRISPRSIEELRELTDEGLVELDRGDGTVWDVDEIKSAARDRLDRLRQAE